MQRWWGHLVKLALTMRVHRLKLNVIFLCVAFSVMHVPRGSLYVRMYSLKFHLAS